MKSKKYPDTIPPNRFQALVDRVLSKVELVDLLNAERIRLKEAESGELTAPCPFHSPQGELSMVVDTDSNRFHCTHCGFKGSAVGWAMYFNGIDFVEAVIDLATHADISWSEIIANDDVRVVKARRNRLMCAVVDGYQQQAAASDEAIAYLKQTRCIDDLRIAQFGIGWCAREQLPSTRRNRDLWRYGVLGRTVKGDYYTRFGGRIVFPIKDIEGHIVGFGGRLLSDSTKGPKYLNSATSRYFQKQSILYGLYESLAYSRSPDRFIFVEGYMDVIALHQAGFHSTVATLGTAINCTQILQLFRFTDQISFCFDLDSAGSDATLKAICQALTVMEGGQLINVITLSEGDDPDSYIREHGASGFSERVNNARCVEAWLSERLTCDALARRRTSRMDNVRAELPADTTLDVSTQARLAMRFVDLIGDIEDSEISDKIRQLAVSTVGTQI